MRDDVEGEDEKSERRKDIEQMEGLRSTTSCFKRSACLGGKIRYQSNTVISFQVIQVKVEAKILYILT